MMQYFEWYLPGDSTLWNKVRKDGTHLANLGINYVWLPPAYKGASGTNDVGYGVYDLYDIGEFDQKGAIPTKYGTKEEYLNAIKELKENNIKVLADIVLNHKMGADELEEVLAVQDDENDRNVSVTEATPIKAWTKYTFPGRGNMYSDFKWDWTHFHGIDWDENTKKVSIYKFYGKKWDEDVDKEKGNFDYLMGADIDMNNNDVSNELIKWGKWYYETTHVDGFRLDAVKHIRADFFPKWLEDIEWELNDKKPIYTVGEYWSIDVEVMKKYIEKTEEKIHLFDVPLHYNMYKASISNGDYNLSEIFDGTLVKERPDLAVTFVDNHDTEPGQALESWVLDWFKPHCYALILLRETGNPCVFYGDYYGIPEKEIPSKNELLDKLLKVRKYFAYGEQQDYLISRNVIGFTRKGDFEHADSGLAVVMSDKEAGSVTMNLGKTHANTVFYDCLGNIEDKVYIDQNGDGVFSCKEGSVSVWIKDGQYVN
ncbi:MAG: alpha-amylase [Clostridia bacterium]|nr:alpha-amylase [Clostridia bacterium]